MVCIASYPQKHMARIIQQIQNHSCKDVVVVDMNTSMFEPVLQDMVKLPMHPTPPADLNTMLKCPEGQVIDVIAMLVMKRQRQLSMDFATSLMFRLWMIREKLEQRFPHVRHASLKQRAGTNVRP